MRRQPFLTALRAAPGADPRVPARRLRPQSAAALPTETGTAGDATSTAALAVVLAVASATALIGLLLLIAEHSKNLQSAGFVCGCAAIAIGVVVALRLPRVHARALARMLAIELGVLSVLALLISQASVAWYPNDGALITAGVLAIAAHATMCLRRGRFPAIPDAAAIAAFALIGLPFLPAADRDPIVVARTALLGAALALVLVRSRSRARPSLAVRATVDVLVPVVLLLVVNDLSYTVPFGDVLHHLNFYVGPTNDVLHGKTVLVNTFSQYGVGVVYALAALFALPGMHLGYGPFELVVSVATALQLAALYVLLRVTVRSQLLALVAVVVAVMWSVFDTISFVSYPSGGVLRFGPPFLLVVLLALAARRPASRGLALASLIAFAICSVWSIEVLVYASAAAGAFVLSQAALARDRRQLRRLWRFAVAALAAFAALVLGTLLRSGQAPSLTVYSSYLDVYAKSHLAWVPIVPFSPSLLLALALMASAAAAAVLSLTGARTARERRTLPLIAALTALGVAEFTWFVDRSFEGVEPKLGLTIIAVGALWLDLLLADRARMSRGRAALIALLCGSAGMLTVASYTAATTALGTSALATLTGTATFPPGLYGLATNASLRARLASVWSSPIASGPPAEGDAESLMRRYDSRPVVVLLAPELTTEVLVRSDRTNVLPMATPSQDGIVPDAASRFVAALSRLPSGTLLLTDREAIADRPPAPPPPTDAVRLAQYHYLLVRLQLIRFLQTRRRLVLLANTPTGAAMYRIQAAGDGAG